ncbi:MAG: enolase C-terminal domain-like protein [Salegentibacter sp.]
MSSETLNKDVLISAGSVSAYKIPTEEPESDGTLQWDHTTLVLVRLKSDEKEGIGYTYADAATARLIQQTLLPLIKDESAMNIDRLWYKMRHKLRNLGNAGISAMAVSAVDNALWDLKAKLLDLPLCTLLGQVKEEMPVYASGGFTSYDPGEIAEKFQEWKEEGHNMFKMKIGRNWGEDLERMSSARFAIGRSQLFVDANGAYYPKDALAMAQEMTAFDVRWFEEPVTSDDLEGMKFVRERLPVNNRLSSGEYGYTLSYFKRMLSAEAIDVLQADATRCEGITGFLKAHTLCESFHRPFSSHCAPALHLHPALSLKNIIHMEYFRDHVLIERELFDGTPIAKDGKLKPDLSRPGHGLEFKTKDAAKYQINF